MNGQPFLRRGEFFGSPVVAQQFGGFLLSVTDYPHGAVIRWHGHDEPYLTYVIKGGYRERVRNATRDCAQHDLVVHPAGEIHADAFATASRCLNIHIDSDSRPRFESALDTAGIAASDAISATMARAARELRRPDGVSPIVVEGLMLELFGELTRHRTRDSAPSWLMRVRDEIMQHFDESLSLTSLAASASVHPVHLARSFRRHFGCTVGDLVRERRVEDAKTRIRNGAELSVVAEEAGFADQSHLGRTFRSLTGMTPGRYRRANPVPKR